MWAGSWSHPLLLFFSHSNAICQRKCTLSLTTCHHLPCVPRHLHHHHWITSSPSSVAQTALSVHVSLVSTQKTGCPVTPRHRPAVMSLPLRATRLYNGREPLPDPSLCHVLGSWLPPGALLSLKKTYQRPVSSGKGAQHDEAAGKCKSKHGRDTPSQPLGRLKQERQTV